MKDKMTVKELRARLAHYDDDDEVAIVDDNEGEGATMRYVCCIEPLVHFQTGQHLNVILLVGSKVV